MGVVRRPQTKVPFAYFRTATRHRGRPVHRIYSATPRPEIDAFWGYIFGDLILVFTKDFNTWWWYDDFLFGDFERLRLSTSTGALWSEEFWIPASHVYPVWPPLVSGSGNVYTGAWGACPYTLDRTFTRP